jgi:hypothetical protein
MERARVCWKLVMGLRSSGMNNLGKGEFSRIISSVRSLYSDVTRVGNAYISLWWVVCLMKDLKVLISTPLRKLSTVNFHWKNVKISPPKPDKNQLLDFPDIYSAICSESVITDLKVKYYHEHPPFSPHCPHHSQISPTIGHANSSLSFDRFITNP